MNKCIRFYGSVCFTDSCPNMIADKYPQYGFPNINCSDCEYNKGCEECQFYNYEICLKKEIKYV